ncbi:MAG: integrase family protein [Burkholderiales bacterium]|nr:integrase family protein [Burkholderiales bacterium]
MPKPAAPLTDARVQAMRTPGKWVSESIGGRGGGSLVVRVAAGGSRLFYFRYADAERRQRLIALGRYDREGRSGLTLSQAREKAAEFSRRYRAGDRFLREHLAAERRAEAERLAEAERRAREAERGTLAALFSAYADFLERRGSRQTARNARSLFRTHVAEPWPEYAERRAAELRPGEITTILRAVAEQGKGRTAAKLRAYLRAAYALALRAEHDATAPALLRTFGIESNPVAATAALAAFNRVRDRVLSAAELGGYLRSVEALPAGPVRSALLLALYLGGQRPAQLLRLTPADVDLEARTVTLRDPKGRRTQPRLHVLPLTDPAAAIVEEALRSAAGHWVFSASGKKPLRPEVLGRAVREISRALSGEGRGPFELRDIRRTCETMLAALGIGRDVRAQIQSHGLGGVQSRHYDRHSYMREKVAALEAWAAHLALARAGELGKVVPIRSARAQAQ